MTSMYPGQMDPWQNRPSLIACWEHSCSGQEVSGSAVTSVNMFKDTLSLSSIWACIPRACRLTRVCVHWFYSTNPSGTVFTSQVFTSNECELNAVGHTFTFGPGTGGFVANCFCTDLNIMFEECDVWYHTITFAAGGVTFPIFRTFLHFELR